MFKSGKKGFTIIELLVVVSIISILSSVGIAATNQTRNKTKSAKVKTEAKSIQNAFEINRLSDGGFPNPDPGQRKLYCIGTTNCSIRGKAVPQRLNMDGLPEFAEGDLVGFNGPNGFDQGFIYMSCGDPDVSTCDPEDTALIFGDPFGDYYDFFGDGSGAIEMDDNFDWASWGINIGDYDDYTSGNGGDPGGFVCAPPTYPIGTFEAYDSVTSALVLSSPYCTYDSGTGRYNCTLDCFTAQYHFQTNVVYPAYPNQYQNVCQEQFPNQCVDYMGTLYCNSICD